MTCLTNDEVRRIDAVNLKCMCCGKMIPHNPIVKIVKEKRMLFCSEDCHKLYLEYKLGMTAS